MRSTLFDSVKGIAIFGIIFIHLASWLLVLEDGSTLATLKSAGLLGVELTFIVNSFFLARHFDTHKYKKIDGWFYIVKSFLRIIPIYWMALFIYWISLKIAFGECTLDYLNILSHFLFFNFINPKWWTDFMGGSGYFGVLALMWLIFPLYMKVAKGWKSAIIFTLVVICIASYIQSFIVKLNNDFGFYNEHDVHVWIWYIKRGLCCYALGISLYYLSKLEISILEKYRSLKLILVYTLLVYLAYKCSTKGGGFDSVRFSLLSCLVILFSIKEKIYLIDNPMLVFMGRNITELFVLHVVLYYVFVDHHKLLTPGIFTFVFLFSLSLVMAPLLKKVISIPIGNLLCEKYSSILDKLRKNEI